MDTRFAAMVGMVMPYINEIETSREEYKERTLQK
jgi:hypothetical protein